MRKKLWHSLFAILTASLFLLGGCEMKQQSPSVAQSSQIEVSNEVQFENEVSVHAPYIDPEKPTITLNKTEYSQGESILVNYANTDEKDWIGIYPEGCDPGSVNSIVWNYSVGKGTLAFDTKKLGSSGIYWIFLCDNDGYGVLDMIPITIFDNDTADYGALSATVNASVENLYSRIEIAVTPSSEEELSYRFYWSKGEERLAGYEPIYTTGKSGKETFTVKFNECLFMPAEADGIEVAVEKGRSKSLFIPVSAELKVPKSTLLYKFNVLTDLHISESHPQHTSHLKLALTDIIAQGESSAIFTVGDNTDRGTVSDYKLLLDTVNNAGEYLPNIYYAIGNHDVVYNNNAGYDKQIALFKEKTNMPGAYYSVKLNGTKFIVLGSDTAVGEGTVGKEQLEWLKSELASTDINSPVFLFLHQPLIETVSGSLYSQDNEIQDWFGIIDTADEIRAILKNYPNAFLFTGHTHWTLESLQPALFGYGKDANFVNCASVGYLWDDSDKATGGSEGYYIEVYEDYILLRGREFIKGNWCAAAQFIIPITKGE